MTVSLRILVGLLMACVGMFWIAQNPFPASGALLVGGLLILDGLDRCCRDEQ